MEILYLDYLNTSVDGIQLVTDKENSTVEKDTNEFKFKEILDGYHSFIDGNEIPLERADILENIQTIKELERTDEDKEGFKTFLTTYKYVIDKLILVSDNFVYKESDFESTEFNLSGPPFGLSAIDILKKSQSLTGFGSAMNFLRSRRSLALSDIKIFADEISLSKRSGKEVFILLNKYFDYIRNNSKKVGNDQRFYFKTFYTNLFDPENTNFKAVDDSADNGYKRIKERLESEGK